MIHQHIHVILYDYMGEIKSTLFLNVVYGGWGVG